MKIKDIIELHYTLFDKVKHDPLRYTSDLLKYTSDLSCFFDVEVTGQSPDDTSKLDRLMGTYTNNRGQ